MRTPRPIPDALMGRAFTRAEAGEHGVTPRMLQHSRFTEAFPSVIAQPRRRPMGPVSSTRVVAASLLTRASVTSPACTSWDSMTDHCSRCTSPLARDLHLAIDDIYLHRTVKMPLHDANGVSTEAAFVGAASTLRLIDLIKVGDWLVHRGHLDLTRLAIFAAAEPWRPGAVHAMKAIPHLDGRSRSLKESETRAVLVFAGLPMPDVNRDIYDGETLLGCADLVYLLWQLVIEYEGRQHAFDVAQFDRDIHRYAGFRSGDWEYVQVTNAKLARPRALVLDVRRVLKTRGYDGPPPAFGARWNSLFARPRLQAVERQPNERAFG